MAGGEPHAPPPLEKQFEVFRAQLEESGTLRDRIRAVVSEIESTTRLIHSGLLLVHQSRSTPGTASFWCEVIVMRCRFVIVSTLYGTVLYEMRFSICDCLLVEAEVLEKPKAQIVVLKELYNRLAEIVRESPGNYYRFVELSFRIFVEIGVMFVIG